MLPVSTAAESKVITVNTLATPWNFRSFPSRKVDSGSRRQDKNVIFLLKDNDFFRNFLSVADVYTGYSRRSKRSFHRGTGDRH